MIIINVVFLKPFLGSSLVSVQVFCAGLGLLFLGVVRLTGVSGIGASVSSVSVRA